MDSQIEKTFGKTNRRGFLGRVAAAAGLGVIEKTPLAGLVKFSESTDKYKENAEIKGRWKMEDVLHDPTLLIDEVLHYIESQPEAARKAGDTSFLELFSRRGDKKDYATDYKKVIIEGYKKYGEEILQQRKRINDLRLFPGEDIDYNLPFFTHMLRPFRSFVDQLNLHGNVSVSFQEYNDLVTVANWFNLSLTGSYVEQKERYVQFGKNFVDSQSIIENIQAEWDEVAKLQRWGKIEGWPTRRREGENVLIGILKVIQRRLPLALADFRYFSFEHGRGYYREDQAGRKGQYVGVWSFFRGIDKWLEQKAGKVTDYGWTAQDYFSQYLYELMHELGHGVGPLYDDRPNRFFVFNPKDYFDFLSGHLDMYENFKVLLDGDTKKGMKPMTWKEVEGWFLDQLGIRVGFGCDEITSKHDATMVFHELGVLHQICSQLEHSIDSKKYQKAIKEMKLDELFIKNKMGMFWNWQDQLGQKGEHSPEQMAFFTYISSFDRISMQHIDEMQKMVKEIFIDEKGGFSDFERRRIGDVVVRMKSMYMLASFVLLRGFEKTGLLEKSNIAFYDNYKYVTNLVNWQLAHAAVGPLGMYLKLAGNEYDIRRLPEEQLELIFETADLNRRYKFYGNNLPLFFKRFYQQVVKLQGVRANLWGAKDNSVYPQIAKDVIKGILGLDDLYKSQN